MSTLFSSESREQILVPLLPVRHGVLFPGAMLPLAVGRSRSVAAVEESLRRPDRGLIIVAQRNPETEDPGIDDLHSVGTQGAVRRLNRTPQGFELLIQGLDRVRLSTLEERQGCLFGSPHPLVMRSDDVAEVEALRRNALDLATRVLQLASHLQVDFHTLVGQSREPMQLVYMLASVLNLELEQEQSLLAADSSVMALQRVTHYLTRELQVLELRQKINNQATSEITREQRDYLLRQQMRAIQQELGEEAGEQAEGTELAARLAQADLPDDVRAEAQRELHRFHRTPRGSPDHPMMRSWLELVCDLPWRTSSTQSADLVRARQILDQDHYDLEDVKERICEHLAVLQLNPGARAPLLCFVGPPGVGKTSLGISIARALGRPFERTSLGGVHDEGELRGHRRTYIGAMPGRLISALRRAHANNPVLMLDEIDKLGVGFQGDPAAALMEILDPAQNHAFRDNYLDLPFDLSKVFFITTANTLDAIPRPLLDRMEIMRLAGYGDLEKIEIARRYLIPRQWAECGLPADPRTVPPEVLSDIVTHYTREAGVRTLERTLGRLARKLALRLAQGAEPPLVVHRADLPSLLGPQPHLATTREGQLEPGVSVALAWTENGGEILYVEALRTRGVRGLTLTGHLGDVMQESVRAAHSYVLSRAKALGLPAEHLLRDGIHVHVPTGATPKDGPSAGVAMVVALASAYLEHPAASDTATTGEITLTGLVLPVGGIKEKLLAARRAGLKRVLLPRLNEADLHELPTSCLEDLEIVLVDTVEQVLSLVLPTDTLSKAQAEQPPIPASIPPPLPPPIQIAGPSS